MAGGGHCIDLDAGAGGGEVVHVAGAALLPGVRRAVAHAGVMVMQMVRDYLSVQIHLRDQTLEISLT